MGGHAVSADLMQALDRIRVARGLIAGRWVAVGLLALAAVAVGLIGGLLARAAALIAAGGMLAFLNIVLWRGLNRGDRESLDMPPPSLRRLIAFQVSVDAVALLAVVYLTGGVISPAVILLPVFLAIETTLLSRPVAVLCGLATLSAVGMMALLKPPDVLSGLLLAPDGVIPAVVQLGCVALSSAVLIALVSGVTERQRQTAQWLRALIQTTEAVPAADNARDLLQELVGIAAAALGVRAALARLLDETTEDLRLAAAWGLSQPYLDKGPVNLGGSRVDDEAMAGQAIIVQDVAVDQRLQYNQQILDEGIRSMLIVPIAGKTKPLGVLHLYATHPRRFKLNDATLATAIARQAGVALESMRVCANLETEAKARAQFVQMVTHELRSPVAGSQVLLKTMTCGLAGDLDEQQLDVLKRIDVRLATLREMVEDLLDLAATKTVDLDEPVGRLPLQPVLKSVVDRLTPEAKAKGLKLVIDVPFEVLAVRATETGVKRVLENLIGNAIKYTPQGGSVKVCVVERPGGVVITISDTGIGIPEEDLPRLWRDFYRASNARDSGIPGTGLGLSIVRQFVDHFGGMISVQSTVGEGTTFKVTLPAATAADDVAVMHSQALML